MAKRKKIYETTDYAAFIRRAIAAHGRRVADADVEDLAELLALREDLDRAIAVAVAGQREGLGRSWADIARASGTSRQAAEKRWGRRSA
jgi:hypothetical protein